MGAPATPLEQLALELMEIDATSGREQEYAAFCESVLGDRGYDTRREEVVDGRFNVAANADEKSVLLCTHLDTVPPHFGPRLEDDLLRGRGACDTKGILAAMIHAGDRLREEGIDDFGYLLVVGEEVDGIGAQKANETHRARFVVVGEPTERKLVLGHKGVVKFRLHVKGKAGHSAYPETGHSAIHELQVIMGDLLGANYGRDELLGEANLNLGLIAGGRAANVIADEAMVEGMLRAVRPALETREMVARVVAGRGELDWLSLKDPSHMRKLEGFETTIVNFSTDIPFLCDAGEPLLYGPGSILDAHTAHEKIRRDDLAAAVSDYVRIVKMLLSSG